MTAHGCSRQWQAEAIDDGRLDGAERAAFERHASRCSACTKERLLWERLRQLAQVQPLPKRSELQRRRLRQQVLREADALITGRAAETTGVLRSALAAAAAVLLAVGVWGGVGKLREPRGQGVVTLAKSKPRLAGQTRAAMQSVPSARAAVTHGQVEAASLAPPPGRDEQSEVLTATTEATAAPGRATPPAPSSGPRTSSRRAAAKPPVAKETAGSVFALAMQAFSRGDYELAEQRLLDFERKFAGDARAEDAAFLRAVCRQRRGDGGGAAEDAADYLQRYPGGFRRSEARAILTSH